MWAGGISENHVYMLFKVVYISKDELADSFWGFQAARDEMKSKEIEKARWHKRSTK